MARKYFGTDGMRGEANKDLTIDLVTNLGLALGYHLKKQKKGSNKPKVILGSDTRISGYMIRSALSAGLTSMGVRISCFDKSGSCFFFLAIIYLFYVYNKCISHCYPL